MGLTLGAVTASFIALIVLNTGLRSWLDEALNNQNAAETVSFVIGLIALAFSVSGIISNIKAFKTGDRSWSVWVGLVLSIVLSIFWLTAFVVELFFAE